MQLKRKKTFVQCMGKGAMTDWTCDAPRSGRPVEVDSDQIKTLTENNQRYTTWEIEDISK